MEKRTKTAQELVDELNAIPLTVSIPLTPKDGQESSSTEPHPILRLLTSTTKEDTTKDG